MIYAIFGIPTVGVVALLIGLLWKKQFMLFGIVLILSLVSLCLAILSILYGNEIFYEGIALDRSIGYFGALGLPSILFYWEWKKYNDEKKLLEVKTKRLKDEKDKKIKEIKNIIISSMKNGFNDYANEEEAEEKRKQEEEAEEKRKQEEEAEEKRKQEEKAERKRLEAEAEAERKRLEAEAEAERKQEEEALGITPPLSEIAEKYGLTSSLLGNSWMKQSGIFPSLSRLYGGNSVMKQLGIFPSLNGEPLLPIFKDVFKSPLMDKDYSLNTETIEKSRSLQYSPLHLNTTDHAITHINTVPQDNSIAKKIWDNIRKYLNNTAQDQITLNCIYDILKEIKFYYESENSNRINVNRNDRNNIKVIRTHIEYTIEELESGKYDIFIYNTIRGKLLEED